MSSVNRKVTYRIYPTPSQGSKLQDVFTLHHRHSCVCGLECSRDENAARVVLGWALEKVNQTSREPAGCGVEALATTLKHETPPNLTV